MVSDTYRYCQSLSLTILEMYCIPCTLCLHSVSTDTCLFVDMKILASTAGWYRLTVLKEFASKVIYFLSFTWKKILLPALVSIDWVH